MMPVTSGIYAHQVCFKPTRHKFIGFENDSLRKFGTSLDTMEEIDCVGGPALVECNFTSRALECSRRREGAFFGVGLI